MAKYDYECEVCLDVREVEHGMTEAPDITCEKCGGDCHKTILCAPRVSLKGTGWASDGYTGKSNHQGPTPNPLKAKTLGED